MNDIIDCITSLKDLAVLGLLWFGASGLIWLHDIVKAKREFRQNETVEQPALNKTP